MFGPYRLISVIGRGGIGEVWRAVDTSQGDRVVALKVLSNWLAADDGYVRRFQRESELAAGLNSPHIVPIHRYGEIDGRLFIDMPLIDGDDLAALLRKEGNLPVERAVGIVAQVARALTAAHRSGLVHRDVKPSNILIADNNGEDHVYLIDFGLSRSVDDSPATFTSRAMIGTLAYTAPERFSGLEGYSGDVYALGCVLHESITGAPPFPSGDPLVLMNSHLNAPVPATSTLGVGIPAAMDEVTARALAKHPHNRYASALDLAVAAWRAIAVESARASQLPEPLAVSDGQSIVRHDLVVPADAPTDVAPRSAPTGGRHGQQAGPPRPVSRRRIILAAVAATASITAIAAATWPRRPVSLATFTGHGATVTALTTSVLDGRSIVFSAGADNSVRMWDTASGQLLFDRPGLGAEWIADLTVTESDGVPVVALASVDAVGVWILRTGESVLGRNGFGGDGFAAATGRVAGSYFVVTAAGSALRVSNVETDERVGNPFDGHSSPITWVDVVGLDGKAIVVSGAEDGQVLSFDLLSGAPLASSRAPHDGAVLSIASARVNGRTVVLTGGADQAVRMWDLATGDAVGPPMIGHAGAVGALVTAGIDGVPIAFSGGQDSIIRMWDLRTSTVIGDALLGHAEGIYTLDVTRVEDRPVLVSGAGDRTIRTWDVQSATLMAG